MHRPAVLWPLLLVLVLSPLGAAASHQIPLEAELDYRLNGQIDGDVAVHTLPFIESTANGQLPPPIDAFRLEAAKVHATIVSTYETETPGLPSNLNLREPRWKPSDEFVEHKDYTSPVLELLQATSLWNVIAFPTPQSAADAAAVTLPHGTYTIANLRGPQELLRPEVPRTPAVAAETEPLRATNIDRLVTSAEHVQAQVRGDFSLLLYGGSFRILVDGSEEDVSTGTHTQLTTRPDRPVPVPTQERVNTTVILRVVGGVLDIAASQDLVRVSAPEFHVVGRLTLDHASGTLEWPDHSETTQDAPLVLDGDLRVAARGAAYDSDGEPYGGLIVAGSALVPIPTSPAELLVPLAALGAVSAAAAALRWVPGARRFLFAAIAGFSMVGKDDALDHRTRSQILEHVRSNPGSTLSTVQRDLGLGWGTTGYHVGVLERLGMVVTKRSGGKRLLFVNGHSRILEPDAWSMLQNPTVRQLADHYRATGALLTQREAAELLACSPQYAGRLLRRLTKLGLVQSEGESVRGRGFRATSTLLDLERRVAPGASTVPVAAVPLAA